MLILFPFNGETTAHTFSIKPDTKLRCIEEYNITQVEEYYTENVKEKREKARKIQKKQKSIFYKIFSKFRKTKSEEQVFIQDVFLLKLDLKDKLNNLKIFQENP